jgi:hypothetical protein
MLSGRIQDVSGHNDFGTELRTGRSDADEICA